MEKTVQYTISAKEDIKQQKMYILENFRYREYGENYSEKIKEAESRLRSIMTLPAPTGFYYRGYNIYLLVHKTYLFPYIVEDNTITVIRVFENGMDWKKILTRWVKQN